MDPLRHGKCRRGERGQGLAPCTVTISFSKPSLQLLIPPCFVGLLTDDDDARSIATVIPYELGRVDEEDERESLTEMINGWKRGVEGKWSSVQEEWSVEEDCLRHARDKWELKTKRPKNGIVTRIESRLSIAQQQDGHPFMNGSAKPNGQGLARLAPTASLPTPCDRGRGRSAMSHCAGEQSPPVRLPHHPPIPTPKMKKSQLRRPTMVPRLQIPGHGLLGQRTSQVTWGSRG